MYWVTGTPGTTETSRARRRIRRSPDDLRSPRGRRACRGSSTYRTTTRRSTFRSPGATPTQVVRAPLLAYARYVDDPVLASTSSRSTSTTTTSDAARCRRCRTSSPPGPSETPRPVSPTVRRSSATSSPGSSAARHGPSSALMLTYADWGGWYDHVAPPRSTRSGSGSACRRCSSARTHERGSSITRRSSTRRCSSSSRTTGAWRRSPRGRASQRLPRRLRLPAAAARPAARHRVRHAAADRHGLAGHHLPGLRRRGARGGRRPRRGTRLAVAAGVARRWSDERSHTFGRAGCASRSWSACARDPRRLHAGARRPRRRCPHRRLAGSAAADDHDRAPDRRRHGRAERRGADDRARWNHPHGRHQGSSATRSPPTAMRISR